ncbi:MAG: sialidase family protein [Chloroflexota bacterium]
MRRAWVHRVPAVPGLLVGAALAALLAGISGPAVAADPAPSASSAAPASPVASAIPGPSSVTPIADFGPDSSRPFLAADPARDRVYAAWTTYIDDTHVVSHLASSADGGRTFGDPIVIGWDSDVWPILRVADDGTLIVAWTHWQTDVLLNPEDPYSNAAWGMVARSTDGGRTLSEPVLVEADRPVEAHYYLNMAASRDGQTVSVAWFDYTPFNIPTLPQPGREAVTMWAASSQDGGATFGAPAELTEDTCVCCMEAGVVQGGHPAFVFRHWTAGGDAGDLRNPAIITSTDQGDTWAAPVTIHDDQFYLPVCPHVGFGAVVDRTDRLHVTWWTGAPDRAGYWYSTSPDGVAFTEPVLLAPQAVDPHENDAAVGVDDGGTVYATTVDPGAVAADGSSDPASSQVTVWRIADGGAPEAVMTVVGRFPQVAGMAQGAYLTWVDASDQLVGARVEG